MMVAVGSKIVTMMKIINDTAYTFAIDIAQ